MATPVDTTAYAFEMFLSGSWQDKTGDVRATNAPLSFGGGIRGIGPADKVASTGSLVATMNNITSAGVIGRYSPGHANALATFGIGTPVRISFSYGGVTKYKFIGLISNIKPEAGPESYVSTITALDWMDIAGRTEVLGVPVTVGTNAGAIINAVLALMPSQPNAVAIGTGTDDYPFAPSVGAGGKAAAASEFQRCCLSEWGLMALRGGTSAAANGTLTFLSRLQLVNSPYNASVGTLAGSMISMDPTRSQDSVLNVFRSTVNPRRVDALAGVPVVLYSHESTPTIEAGGVLKFIAKYVDPNQLAQNVGGYAMIQPVNGTDIVIVDAAGADIYASFTVSVTYSSDAIIYQLTNNGAVAGRVTFLQARGWGLYNYNPVEVEKSDAASIASWGEVRASLSFPYQSDESWGANVGAYMLRFWRDPLTHVPSVTFCANADDTRMLLARNVEPMDLVTVSESVSGVSGNFRVMSADYDLFKGSAPGKAIIMVTWGLSPFLVDTTVYGKVGNATLGKIGNTFRLML